MINIVIDDQPRTGMIGPAKRERNLRKGLDQIGYPYVVRKPLGSTKRLWIDGWPDLIPYLPKRGVHTVIGPNTWRFQTHVSPRARLDNAMLIHGSQRAAEEFLGGRPFVRCPVRSWAGGIDTDEFRPSADRRPGGEVLVYNKRRHPVEIPGIIETLLAHGLRPSLIVYGRYTEQEYRDALAKADFVVWHARNETQGFALQEALACDVPVLVCNEWFDLDARRAALFGVPPGRRLLECAPYFDERCGLRIESLDELSGAVAEMLDRLAEFRPREYVLENLNLEKCAREFVALWEEWELSFEQGLHETCSAASPFTLPWPMVARQLAGSAREIARHRVRRPPASSR